MYYMAGGTLRGFQTFSEHFRLSNCDMVKAIEADTALGRFGEPSEVAAIVAFLASTKAAG
jgi:NAD(P)-dependent dehydrogenase (short-subunit alcohol dehydrogenase family)